MIDFLQGTDNEQSVSKRQTLRWIIDFDVFAKTGRIVITNRLGISEWFQQRWGFENLFGDQFVFSRIDLNRDIDCAIARSSTSTHRCQIVHNQFGALRFSTTTFTTVEDKHWSSATYRFRRRRIRSEKSLAAYLITTHWFILSVSILLCAAEAVAKICLKIAFHQ